MHPFIAGARTVHKQLFLTRVRPLICRPLLAHALSNGLVDRIDQHPGPARASVVATPHHMLVESRYSSRPTKFLATVGALEYINRTRGPSPGDGCAWKPIRSPGARNRDVAWSEFDLKFRSKWLVCDSQPLNLVHVERFYVCSVDFPGVKQ